MTWNDFESPGMFSDDNRLRRNDRNDRDDRHLRVQPQVALNASTGGVGALPIITTLFAAPINVVSTSIDTRRFRTTTTNLLHFSSIINLPLGISVTFNFQILRSRDDGSAVKVGSTYTFSTIVDVLESEAFGFQFADTDVAPGNYTYSIEISTNSIIDITPGATINNATLSVLAVADLTER